MKKVLADKDYWEALDKISGNLLTIFYLPSHTENFGEDLLKPRGIEKRSMYKLSVGEPHSMIVPMIKEYLQYERPIKLPTILFFQTDGQYIQDYFFIELSEEKIQESFIELKSYIVGAVDELQRVRPEYYGNSEEIFNRLKDGVNAVSFKRKAAKVTGSFPFQQFMGWLLNTGQKWGSS